jgi:hypothetical protein
MKGEETVKDDKKTKKKKKKWTKVV